MAGIIHLLPDNVVNQIAAGEVIQRPASIIKELMENSIDSGASKIDVKVKEAGRSYILIQDNGCGMSKVDARMCFERHATSKINKHDDLYEIRSFGFRGEAMASIGAVAHVELKTKRSEDELGTLIQIEGGKFKKQEDVSTKDGTSIVVKNLFFNVPARRNFLKSDNVELRHVIEEFNRVALAYPKLSFSLKHNDRQIHKLKASNLSQRIVNIMGGNSQKQLVPVSESTTIVNIEGFIGKPEFAKKIRGEQYFFVNNRFIRSPYLHHAVMNAFEGLISTAQFPLYVLFLNIDPTNIDINVHPTKSEIKFSDEKSIYAILNSGIKRSLSQYSVRPTIDFNHEREFAALGANFKDRRPMNNSPFHSGSFGKPLETSDQNRSGSSWLDKYKLDKGMVIEQEPANQEITFNENGIVNQDKPVFQLHGTYILAQIKSGMMLIDQAASHERILYEQFLSQIGSETANTQRILFQEQLDLSSKDALILHDILDQVNDIGFDIEAKKADEFVIKGVPANLELGMTKDIIHDLLDQYKRDKQEFKNNVADNLARSLARSCSVKQGRILNEAEMNSIINELFACSMPYYDPNGRPTITKLNLEQISAFFKKPE